MHTSFADSSAFELQRLPLAGLRSSAVPPSVFAAVVRAFDLGMLLAAGVVALWSVHQFRWDVVRPGYLLCIAIAACASAACLSRLEGRSLPRLCSFSDQVRLLAVVLPTGAVALFCSVSVLQYGVRPMFSGATALLAIAWLAASGLMMGAMRLAVTRVAANWRRNGRLGRRVALLGTTEGAVDFMAHLRPGPADELQILGCYEDEAPGNEDEAPRNEDKAHGNPGQRRASGERLRHPDLPYLGSVRELIAQGQRGEVDAVVITLPADEPVRIEQASAVLASMTVDLYVCHHLKAPPRPVAQLGGVPVAVLSRRPLSEWQVVQKRLFDLLGSAVLILGLSPLLLLLALIVKLDSGGPVLFRQMRIGFNNLPFICLKFRTMHHHAADALADRQTTRDDPRVTTAGRWMRRLSLDELPQLVNVLRGEMSLVGPRPHAPNTRAGGQFFANAVHEYALRHRVKPGITGWAQVNGWRGETTTVEQIEQRVRHDLHYIQNWSLTLDLRILLMTALRGFGGPQAF